MGGSESPSSHPTMSTPEVYTVSAALRVVGSHHPHLADNTHNKS